MRVAILSLSVAFPIVASAGELIANGGMEPPFANGLAQGWGNNCWGRNTVAFSPGEPHSGTFSQKVTCTAFDSGAAQFLYPLAVKAGKHYRISLWMRAEGGVGSVGVGLRQGPAPYTMHLSAAFEPGEDWERFAFEGTSQGSDERAGLFVWFSPDAPATLWVDDVSVIEGEPQAVELPLPTGNAVPNASFEVALERAWRSRNVHPRYDAGKPFHGTRSLRWDLDGGSDQLAARLLEFGGKGETFTLALAARAEGKATVVAEVWPGVVLNAAKPLLRLESAPKAEWSVFRTTGPLPSSANGCYYLAINLRSEGRATVWLDAIRLEPGDGSAPFRCSRPVECSLASQKLAHIHREGERIRLDVQAFNDADEPRKLDLTCRVTDYWRRPVAEVPVRLAVGPHATGSSEVKLPIRCTGVFLAELVEGSEVLSELSFSVLPPVSRVPAERSAVGGHFRLDDFHMRVANAMGIKWTRIHDCETITHWATAEPEKGRFVWFDDKVQCAKRHGVQILGEFLRVPVWASSAGPEVKGHDICQCPPRDLDEFAAYVRAVVGHYKRDIHHWEIWNEPYGEGFWRGTPEQYAALAKVAARETHAADPAATTLAPCAHPNSSDWVGRALAAGALEGADAFSYHGYDVFQPKAYGQARTWAAHGRTQPRPIWNTETGPTARTFYRNTPDKFVDGYTTWLRPLPYEVATEHAVKLLVMALAGGADRYFQYWCVYEESLLPRLSAMTVFEYDASLRPMAVAYAVAGALLDGTRGQGWVEMPDRVLASILGDSRRAIAVLWRRGGRRARPVSIPFSPSNLEARDLMGAPLKLARKGEGFELSVGGEPIYLVTKARHASALLEALRKASR